MEIGCHMNKYCVELGKDPWKVQEEFVPLQYAVTFLAVANLQLVTGLRILQSYWVEEEQMTKLIHLPLTVSSFQQNNPGSYISIQSLSLLRNLISCFLHSGVGAGRECLAIVLRCLIMQPCDFTEE